MKDAVIFIISFLNTLQGICDALSREMLAQVGYEADLNLKLGTGVSTGDEFRDFASTVLTEMKEVLFFTENPPKSIKDYKPMLIAWKNCYQKMKAIEEFDAQSTATDPDWKDIGEQVSLKVLKKAHPVLFAILELLEVFKEEEKDATPRTQDGKFLRFAHTQTSLNTANIGRSPADIIRERYFAEDHTPQLLIEKLNNILLALGIPCTRGIKPVDEIGDIDAETREMLNRNLACWFTIANSALFGCTFTALKAGDIDNQRINQDAPVILVTPVVGLTNFQIPAGNWDLAFSIADNFPAFYFNDTVIRSVLEFPDETFSMGFSLTKKRGEDNGVAFLFGPEDGTRLELGEISLSWGVVLSEPDGENFKIALEVKKGKFVFDNGDGDGLSKRLLPDKGLEFDFDFKLQYSNTKGLHFEGQAGTELIIPSGRKIGSAFSIPEIQLGFKLSQGLGIYASLSGQTKIGPASLEIGRTGVQLDLLPKKAGQAGNLGFADVDLRFKPPTQIGVVVDAKLIEGGGFLSFDTAAGQYFGIVYLTVKRKIEIKAIGIIQTRMPDGSEGFSFLLLLTFEFPAVTLPFGFRLEGVGGLVGIHRTIDREALLVGMKDNTLDNILFPEDPVKNAAVIVRQANAVFPPAENSHTFGIMFLLSWGSKSLVQLKLGLVLKYQDPTIIALLGVMKIGVEKTVLGKKVTVFTIQVNFKADYEEGSYFALDASMYKSTFLGFQLIGDLCVRWKGSPDPYFLLSAGGFHPDFHPPALNLPKELQRLKFIVADSDAVKISGYAYLAVTSNTVQFGGGFDAYIKVWKLSVEGNLKLDVIFYRTGNPNFKASASGRVVVKIWGFTLGGITLKGEFSGFSPWHFEGSVSFEIGWWDYTKSVDKTWGDESDDLAESILLVPLLKEELSVATAWQPVRRYFRQGVAIRAVQATGERLLAHPDESLEVRQNILPLGVQLEHYGHFNSTDFRKFDLRVSGGSVDTDPLPDFFAPAQFFELTQDERLLRKSYDSYQCGVSTKGLDNLHGGRFRVVKVDYERKLVGTSARPESVDLPREHFDVQIRGNAIAKSRTGRRIGRTVRRNFGLQKEEFVIANSEDFTAYEPAQSLAGSEAAVHAAYNDLVRRDSDLARKLVVVPAWELKS